jgi:hypothetical protein
MPTFRNTLFHLHRQVGVLYTYLPMKMEQSVPKRRIIHLLAYEDGTDSVPKRRHIKFRRRGITQKKTYNIQNTAKV